MTDFANFREKYVSHVYDTRIKMPQDIFACSQLMNHVVVRYCEKSKKGKDKRLKIKFFTCLSGRIFSARSNDCELECFYQGLGEKI